MSKLRNIHIKNFRIHRDTNIKITANLLSLVGKNDVGKSSVLDALDVFYNNKNVKREDFNDESGTLIIECDIDGNTITHSEILQDGNVRYDPKVVFSDTNYCYFKLDSEAEKYLHNFTIDRLVAFCQKRNLDFIQNNFSYRVLKNQLDTIYRVMRALKLLKPFIDENEYAKNQFSIFADKHIIHQLIIRKENIFKEFHSFLQDNPDRGNLRNVLNDFFEDINLSSVVSEVQSVRLSAVKSYCDDFLKTGDYGNLQSITQFKYLTEEKRHSQNNIQNLLDKMKERLWGMPGNLFDSLFSDNDFFQCEINGVSISEFLARFDTESLFDLCDEFLEAKPKIDQLFEDCHRNDFANDWLQQFENILESFRSNNEFIMLDKRGSGVRRLCSLYYQLCESVTRYTSNNYIFAIDEPEISLHPDQQRAFVKQLKTISNIVTENVQVFLSTHSPYIVNELEVENVSVLRFKTDGEGRQLDEIDPQPLKSRLLKTPYLSEINYLAFDEASVDYHVALFGFMMRLIDEKLGECSFKTLEGTYLQKKFKDLVTIHSYYRTNNREELIGDKPDNHSLPYCVRNYIDHPHDKNKHFGEYQVIKDSIMQMRAIIEELNKII